MFQRSFVGRIIALLAKGHQLLQQGFHRQTLQIDRNARKTPPDSGCAAAATPPPLLQVVVIASATGIASAGIAGYFPLIDVHGVRFHFTLILSPICFRM